MIYQSWGATYINVGRKIAQSFALPTPFSAFKFVVSFPNYTTLKPNLAQMLKYLTPP